MHIAVCGASGFLGFNLSRKILADTSWHVRAVARNEQKLSRIGKPGTRLELRRADITEYEELRSALKGIDVAYYFVHMMGRKDVDFYQAELTAAKTFVNAADAAGVKRVVYMGGLGDNADSSSRHLRSRHETGEILRRSRFEVIELRASMIIGKGSVAFDIIRNVADKLAVVPLPKEADTKTQPIALSDALSYLIAAATVKISDNIAIDIGGPKAMSYADVYRAYAHSIGKRPLVFSVPFVHSSLAGMFLNLVTPKIHARIGSIMFESMATNMTVQNELAQGYFPAIKPVQIENAFNE